MVQGTVLEDEGEESADKKPAISQEKNDATVMEKMAHNVNFVTRLKLMANAISDPAVRSKFIDVTLHTIVHLGENIGLEALQLATVEGGSVVGEAAEAGQVVASGAKAAVVAEDVVETVATGSKAAKAAKVAGWGGHILNFISEWGPTPDVPLPVAAISFLIPAVGPIIPGVWQLASDIGKQGQVIDEVKQSYNRQMKTYLGEPQMPKALEAFGVGKPSGVPPPSLENLAHFQPAI